MHKILLHICCGPCAIYPILRLREQGFEVVAFFANPNIHPLSEYLRRREAVQYCAEKFDFEVIYMDELWNIQNWLRAVANKQDIGERRCAYCYTQRLQICAQMVQQDVFNSHKFTMFSSSLLYSRYQRHELIIKCAESAAKQYDVKFYYEDFRVGWQQGIDISKEMGIYRQAYCGCIYSEAERYAKKLQRLCL